MLCVDYRVLCSVCLDSVEVLDVIPLERDSSAARLLILLVDTDPLLSAVAGSDRDDLFALGVDGFRQLEP